MNVQDLEGAKIADLGWDASCNERIVGARTHHLTKTAGARHEYYFCASAYTAPKGWVRLLATYQRRGRRIYGIAPPRPPLKPRGMLRQV